MNKDLKAAATLYGILHAAVSIGTLIGAVIAEYQNQPTSAGPADRLVVAFSRVAWRDHALLYPLFAAALAGPED